MVLYSVQCSCAWHTFLFNTFKIVKKCKDLKSVKLLELNKF